MRVEDESKRAGLLERAAIHALEWIEQHAEKKPSLNRPLLERLSDPQLVGIRWVVGAAVLIGGLALWYDSVRPKSSPNFYSANPATMIVSFTDWRSDQQVKDIIDEARKDQDLIVLEPNEINLRLRGVDTIFFLQYSDGATLAINEKALTKLQASDQKPDKTLFFTINDRSTGPTPTNNGATFWIPFDKLFLEKMSSQTKPDLKLQLSSYLSALVATAYEYSVGIGADRAAEIINNPTHPKWQELNQRLLWYQEQFLNEQSKLLIQIVALNPRLLPRG